MNRNRLPHKLLRLPNSPIPAPHAFTLLEVMVCLAVLAVAIPAFLAAIAQNVQLEAMNAETNIALAAANRTIEDVRALGYQQTDFTSLPHTFPATGLANDGRVVKLTNSANSIQVGSVTITEPPGANTKLVEVSVTWRSVTGSDRQITLMTEVNKY